MSMLGQTAYEQWVRRLRQWSKDPDTSLDDLPSLAETINYEEANRLVAHLQKAIDSFMGLFQARLEQAFDVADPQTFAQEYHKLQYYYARRLVLARHPGLPEKLREELARGAERDLQDIQTQIEEVVGRSSDHASLQDNTEISRIVKTNKLTQVLTGEVPRQLDQKKSFREQVNLIPTYDPYAE